MENEEFGWWAVRLTLLNVAVFIMAQLFPAQFYGNLVLVSSQVLQKPWTILTHMFMHADLQHLYFNMFALAVFGSIFEKHVGTRNFLIIYFLGGLCSAAAAIMFYQSTLGASGAIFAVLGALAFFRPRQVVWAIGVPMYVIVAFVIWALIDMAGLFQPDGIAHASHLAGMAFGCLYGLYLRRKMPEPGKGRPGRKEEEHDDLPSQEERDRWERDWMGSGLFVETI
jgi:membrane associated rhomboid family serine protease